MILLSCQTQIAKPAFFPDFPWPPPQPTTMAPIPSNFLRSNGTTALENVASRIETALNANGYFDRSYYGVPGGFALVTRIERINEDGTSRQDGRWSDEYRHEPIFNFESFLSVLFTAQPGYYRVIVFVVSPEIVVAFDELVTREEMQVIEAHGADRLPENLARQSFTQDFGCVALIYEYEQQQTNSAARFLLSSPVQGREHLIKAGIWQQLVQ